jgi:hypothetical protein
MDPAARKLLVRPRQIGESSGFAQPVPPEDRAIVEDGVEPVDIRRNAVELPFMREEIEQ